MTEKKRENERCQIEAHIYVNSRYERNSLIGYEEKKEQFNK